ncbi:hypothetical protein [Martelella limonii]|nr:hypothetical protein [Martelella limonii]
MKRPTRGGCYVRDPKTGKLTPAEAPEATTEPEAALEAPAQTTKNKGA